MGPVVRYLMVDCLGNPHQLAEFWGAVLRRPVQGSAEGCFVELNEDGPEFSLFFQEASGRQRAKGQLHLHLNPSRGHSPRRSTPSGGGTASPRTEFHAEEPL